MERIRENAYNSYIKTHLAHLTKPSLEDLKKQSHVFKARFGPFLPADRRSKILELGCGHGALLYFLKENGYTSVEAVDVSPEQVSLAQSFGFRNVACEDLMDFLQRCEPGSYQMVFMLDVIEHFRKDEIPGLLGLAWNSLKHGGRIVIYTPNAEGLFGARYRYFDLTHEIAFTPQSLAQVLRLSGFERIQFRPVEPYVHGLISLARWMVWKTIKMFLRLYLLAETGVYRGYLLTQLMIAVAEKS